MPDLNANDLDAAEKIIAGTARSMGITVTRLDALTSDRRTDRDTWEGQRGPLDHDLRHHQRGAAHEAQQGLPRRPPSRSTRTSSTPRSRPSGSPRRPRTTKFDATVEVAMRLGVDPRKADQMVRGTVNLPHGTGKTARVLVFATGDRAEEARAAGADFVGSDDLIERGRGRLARLRRRRRDPGPDGQGRPARPGPRPARPDAEPEDRHRHDRRRQGRQRHQGRQDRVPRRPARQPALHHRQGVVHRASSWSRTTPPRSTRSCGSSRPRPRAATSRRSPFATTMGPGIPVDPNRTRNLLTEDDRGLTPPRLTRPTGRRGGPIWSPRRRARTLSTATDRWLSPLGAAEGPGTLGRPAQVSEIVPPSDLRVGQRPRPARLRRGVRAVRPFDR